MESITKRTNQPKAVPKSVANLFFLLGLISAISFRAIILVQHTSPGLVRVFWYFAVITNLIFFLFRYHISLKRKRAINDKELLSKLSTEQPLGKEERAVLTYLLTSIGRSKENLNYLSIFTLSILTIIVDIVIFLQK